MVRQYDALLGSTRELRSAAANLGGSAGELLLDFCTAAVMPCARHHTPPQLGAAWWCLYGACASSAVLSCLDMEQV